MNLRILVLINGLMACFAVTAQMVPFVLPWNDAAPGVTDLSAWNRPIDSSATVGVDANGHFTARGERIRFLGMNFAGDSPFMPTNKADAVAARLAKFGVNNVRFHHMDAPWATGGGLLSYTVNSTRNVNPAQLERLHFLVSRLRAHGVYANINLLVGREYRSGDGLGSEITQVTDWKDQHILGLFDDAALALHQEYATRVLTPVNRFTGVPLARDPAVAFVEILNENGLLQKWFDGGLDKLPARYAWSLQMRWNDWLLARYTNEPALLAAWGVVNQPLGANTLKNGSFAGGLTSWNPEQHTTAKATFTKTSEFTGGQPSAKVQVTTIGSAGWHVQLNQAGLKTTAGKPYTVSFWAKASAATSLDAAVGRAYGDYGVAGYQQSLNLTTEWQPFTATFEAPTTDANLRVNFGGFGNRLVTVWLADVRFQEGGQLGQLPNGASLAGGTIPNVRRSDGFTGTTGARCDWLRFLRDREDRYYEAMVAHLRNSVGYTGLIFGTITANSPANVQAKLDVVDAHAYWQHPNFPGTPWDAVNWTVENKSLVNTLGGDNTLGALALQRVKGKPFTVTEYQHPSPNQYSAEGPLLLAAYGAMQDWDGLWMFDYGPGNDSVGMGRFRGFFDTAQHPTKMANVLLAANLFRRGDVLPALGETVMKLTPDAELEQLLAKGSAWNVFSAAQAGVSGKLALTRRVATSVGTNANGLAIAPTAPAGNVLTSDHGALRWDLTTAGKGVVTVNTPQSKAVIGFADGRTFDLGGVGVRLGTTQMGWATVGVSLVRGESLTNGTALIVTSGRCENTGMVWKDATKTSVGSQWGSAPTLIETVPFTVTLPVASSRVKAWVLSPTGQRGAELPVSGDTVSAILTVTTNAASLWFELEVAPKKTAFQLWRDQHFTPAELADPAISGDVAAPAGDGVANLLKFAYGLPPKSSARRSDLPFAELLNADGQTFLAVSFLRAKTATEVALVPEVSLDLTVWTAGEVTTEVRRVDLGAQERILLRDRTPISTAASRYLRLRLEPAAN